jgi:hypothetical protein
MDIKRDRGGELRKKMWLYDIIKTSAKWRKKLVKYEEKKGSQMGGDGDIEILLGKSGIAVILIGGTLA